MNTEQIAHEERERIMALLFEYKIPDKRIRLLYSVIDNTAWMKAKLDEARATIKNSSVAIPYDNGGGQKGIRENPIFKGYENLFKSYMTGMGKILDVLPDDAALDAIDDDVRPKTVLDVIRAKHKTA